MDDPADDVPSKAAREIDEATATDRAEVRRLVDEGAATPEEIRALAERMREQREREQDLWREQIKPALLKSKKHRPSLSDLKSDSTMDRKHERRFLLGVGAAVLLVLVVLTASSAPAFLIVVLLIAFLAYAYVVGRQPSEDEPAEPAEDEPDS